MSISKINKTKPLSVKALSLINKLKPLVNNEDLSKLQGLHTIEENIDSFNNLDNIDNILLKNMYETEKEFEMRKILTLKIINIDFKDTTETINILTAINIGNMIMSKSKYNLSYDIETENVLKNILLRLINI
jgi:hypothetical protein